MGNWNTTCACKRSKLMRKQMDSMNHNTHHEGIRTVKVNKVCDFSGNSDLCICAVTWNMNGQVVYEDLVELVGSNSKSDLLVVGLQEVPRKNIARLLETALVDTHVLLGEAIMQSLQLYVFGPRNSGLSIKELKVDKHSVGGCGGLIRRKKGAVAIRMSYNGIQMMFISCHLSVWIVVIYAAHARNVEERNSQCRHISHNLFSKHMNPYSRPAQVTVWLGDLNYRIQGIETHPVRNLIQKNLHKFLTRQQIIFTMYIQMLKRSTSRQSLVGFFRYDIVGSTSSRDLNCCVGLIILAKTKTIYRNNHLAVGREL
ncbi:PREDICTED: type I inositol 1,4,5-trisphosphate 5-phosphatase 11 isoform X3 [Populus euphratica]|uniref:Type I inositol 1,4,5-trisphosphate 5-phosphatase 11 isoform X3 n=1 Tax=Populus euphratica TaxID=75702 RepID=A0AAJ6ULW5_POPEU|nr:PREDICTED: type I inositol 1,4,5-trisphosphate 5-phosphatase 11 isoform X3 [Populus euphratica]